MNVAAFPARSRFPIKLICCIPFGSTLNSWGFFQVYCNQLVVFLEVWIIKQATTCVVVSLTCSNIPNVFSYVQVAVVFLGICISPMVSLFVVLIIDQCVQVICLDAHEYSKSQKDFDCVYCLDLYACFLGKNQKLFT